VVSMDLRPASTVSAEGTVDFTTGFRGTEETHQTWYKIVNPSPPDNSSTRDTGMDTATGTATAADAAGKRPLPLVVLHGGPGCTHDYLLSLADLAAGGRQVIFYDQIGNGRSTHLPERGADFWTVDLFVRELHNLLDALGLADGGYHVLGQSWGGFLAQEFALTRPRGLKAVVLANTASSWQGFLDECNKLRAKLPPEVDAVLREHEASGTFSDPEYAKASEVFYQRHVCRIDPMPPDVRATFDWVDRDPTVYHTMNGPSEFHCIGSAVGWSVTGRLGEIGNPALIVSGRHDEAGLPLQATLLDGLPTAELTVFGDSSHMPHWEERDRYMTVVGSWLRNHD
jgi:L-proline amide hydrolase